MPVEGDSPSANNAFPYFINCYRGVAEDSNTNGGGGNGGGQNGPPDDDGDRVGNGWDMCADTGDTTYPDGDPIYPRGCTESQFNALSSDDQDAAKVAYAGDSPPAPPDEDGDGIPDPLDDCEGTESGNLVYSDGCAHSCAQLCSKASCTSSTVDCCVSSTSHCTSIKYSRAQLEPSDSAFYDII